MCVLTNQRIMQSKAQDNNIRMFIVAMFMIVAAFGIGVYIGGREAESNDADFIDTSELYDQAYLQGVLSEIDQYYIGELPDSAELSRGMAKGIIEALGDEYSSFLDPEEAKLYMQSTGSAYEGIGVLLGFEDGYTRILTAMDGQPASTAGVKSGDIILEVDGEDLTGIRPEVVASKILGEAGTDVGLLIYREVEDELIEFEIRRDLIDLENIIYEDLGNGVFMIDILRFTEGADGNITGDQKFNQLWSRIVDEVAEQQPTGLVIDLRNNPGGYVKSVRYVLEEFLPDGAVLMKEEEANGKLTVYYDDRVGKFEDIPIVVLVNEGSASASEIFAGAIQDHQRGNVIGMNTVGKGVEQILLDVEDGSILILVYKQWLTAGGSQLSPENGITPDEEVEYQAPETDGGYDAQVTRALELLGE